MPSSSKRLRVATSASEWGLTEGVRPLAGARSYGAIVRHLVLGALLSVTSLFAADMPTTLEKITLDYTTLTDPALQVTIEAIDSRLREKYGMAPTDTAVGVLDLNTARLALVRPDKIDYAASVPKIAILLAWFQLHPEAATSLDPTTRHELGLMIKVSDNAMAAKYSQLLGLKPIQQVIDSYGLY